MLYYIWLAHSVTICVIAFQIAIKCEQCDVTLLESDVQWLYKKLYTKNPFKIVVDTMLIKFTVYNLRYEFHLFPQPTHGRGDWNEENM